ncbi:MAG: FkbM family methyltransferase [Chitinophagaceae bacterium]|nr:FkbM family methyltransferase [Chitinophagaceae bacterium]
MNNTINKFAKNILPPSLLRFAKRMYRGTYLAKDGLDKKMEAYLNYNNGFFVELGAYDGVLQSNTYHLEKRKNWKGVLVEPAPHKFLECKANRSSRNFIYCAACVPFDFKDEFVKIRYAGFFSTPLNVDTDLTDIEAHTHNGSQYLDEHETIFEFGAKAIPLNRFLEEANAPATIDFLSLDVEGAEKEVLRGIDHDQYRFKYLLIECRDFDALNTYLQSVGYDFKEKLSHHDYLFSDRLNRWNSA